MIDDDPHGQSEMHDPHVGPALSEELGYQPAMAVFGCCLTTKQCRAARERLGVERLMHATSLHQLQKGSLVGRPVPSSLLEGIENVLGRCKQRLVLVFAAEKLTGKVRQVLRLGEPSELRGIVESHVKQTLDVRIG